MYGPIPYNPQSWGGYLHLVTNDIISKQGIFLIDNLEINLVSIYKIKHAHKNS
jgi:hypothetical protein